MSVRTGKCPVRFDRRPLALAGLGVLAAIAAGCGGGDGKEPLVYVSPTAEKTPDSVYREVSPQPRSTQLQAKLNTRRNETFGSGFFSVVHDDVAYTAAYRHAVWLNTVNSNGEQPFKGFQMGILRQNTPDQAFEVMRGEPPFSGPGENTQWPALYTSDLLENRIKAVVGGTKLMQSLNGGIADETYVFDGDIYRDNGSTVQFRGYPQGQGDSVDTIWYSRRGRAVSMRAGLRYFGFGHKDDVSAQGGAYKPPYPIFNGKFLGVATMLSALPAVGAFGYWPNKNNTNVNPYGLDTDLGGPIQYAGPPLHFTLPVDEPFLRIGGIQDLSLTKVSGPGGAGVATKVVGGGDNIVVYANVAGLQVTVKAEGAGVYGIQGPIAPNITGLRVTRWNQTDRITPAIDGASGDEDGYVLITPASGVGNFEVGDYVDIRIGAGLTRPGSKPEDLPDTGTYGRYRVTGVDKTVGVVEIQIGTVETQQANFLFIDDAIFERRKDPITSKATKQFISLDNLEIDLYKTGSLVKAATVDEKLRLRNGEVIVVPTTPLEPSQWYRFQFQAKTPSYAMTEPQVVYFQTNSMAK